MYRLAHVDEVFRAGYAYSWVGGRSGEKGIMQLGSSKKIQSHKDRNHRLESSVGIRLQALESPCSAAF